METLKVSIIQTDIYWENIDANLAHFTNILETIQKDVNLVMLPEMFTTGFSMNPHALATDSLIKGLQWMQRTARNLNCTVAGSIMVEENKKYFNRLFYVFPDSSYVYYDKRHLFSMGKEDSVYIAGSKTIIVNVNGWRIKPLLCYDVRFPKWSRNTEDYDLLTYHASFPERRIKHWDILLQARAIENQCYVAAVNRIGNDGNGVCHNGSSQFISPDGTILQINKGNDVILYQTLSKDLIYKTRMKYPFLKDRD